MLKRSVEAIIGALNRAGVRYLIAGGLAVVAHGYLRFTADIDLVLDLHVDNLQRALQALGGLGYRPRAPVALEQFADADLRQSWAKDKQMRVFSLHSPEHPGTELDLFLDEPFDFDRAYAAAARMEISPGLAATFVSYDDLIALKLSAGRSKDLLDVIGLRKLHRRSENAEGGGGRHGNGGGDG